MTAEELNKLYQEDRDECIMKVRDTDTRTLLRNLNDVIRHDMIGVENDEDWKRKRTGVYETIMCELRCRINDKAR